MSSHVLLQVFREACDNEPEARKIPMPGVSRGNRFTRRKPLRSFAHQFFSTRVCRVSSPFDKVVMQVALLVPIAEKPTLRCTIALIADDSCAWIVSIRIKCWVQRLRDTKSRQSKNLKERTTKHYWSDSHFAHNSSTRKKSHGSFARSVKFAFVQSALSRIIKTTSPFCSTKQHTTKREHHVWR